MRKTINFILILGIIMISFSFGPVEAKNNKKSLGDIPQVSGVYAVPGHPKLKVRVFVHNAKKVKPPQPDPEPVCTDQWTDNNSEAIVGATGWKLPPNWTYNLNPGSAPALIGSANLVNLTKASFDTWQAPSGVTFTRGTDTAVSGYKLDGQNIVAWGRTSPKALGVTYTWYYSDTGEVVEIDTIMNERSKWSWTPYSLDACVLTNTYDAQNILTHEIGHWVGLNDHYDPKYVYNTMFGYGSPGEIRKDTLTAGDISGVDAIYNQIR